MLPKFVETYSAKKIFKKFTFFHVIFVGFSMFPFILIHPFHKLVWTNFRPPSVPLLIEPVRVIQSFSHKVIMDVL